MRLRLWQILLVIPAYLVFAVYEAYGLWRWEAEGGTQWEHKLTWLAYDIGGKPGVLLMIASPSFVLAAGLFMWWRDPFRPTVFGIPPRAIPKAPAPKATPEPAKAATPKPESRTASPAPPVPRRGSVPAAPPPPSIKKS